MILAGRTYKFSLTDGRELTVTLTLGDEVRFERLYGKALSRYVRDGEVSSFVVLGVIHAHLQRTGVAVPDDVDVFADLLVEESFEDVGEGKAEASASTPSTG